jgi:lantibiotic biosynthesis protein
VTTSIDVGPEVRAASDEIAARLARPATVLPDGYQGPARRWPQSLAGGAAGIAVLHIERARTGHGSWATARAWLAEATSGRITAASNASLFFGAPALAFVVRLAAASTGGYRRALAALDDATVSITQIQVVSARARMDRGELPRLREFDLIRGLAGLGAYHLHAHPGHQVTRDVLSCLTRLTEPLPGAKDDLPPWWTGTSPTGEPSREFPGGHANLGMSHGISAALAVISIAIMRGVTVPGIEDAARQICSWTDRWQPGDESAPWWPGVITTGQHEAGHIDPALRPRPSWCYGAAGTARAQQLAGLALGDPGRQLAAETAILTVLRDPAELGRLTEPGLCHGTAGLLQAASRIAADSDQDAIAFELPRVAARLVAQVTDDNGSNPELLDGHAGAALALHTISAGCSPEPGWDAFLALT